MTPILGRRRAEASGQESLFGGDAGVPLDEIDESRVITDAEFDRDDLLRQEKEMLGQYVTDHPLLAVKDTLARVTSMEIVELSGQELDSRREGWEPPPPKYTRGVLAKYSRVVQSAAHGAVCG